MEESVANELFKFIEKIKKMEEELNYKNFLIKQLEEENKTLKNKLNH